MARRIYTPERIINKLREAEVLVRQGSILGEAIRNIGVTEQTYYRWRREYGGMRIEQVKRLKEFEKENARDSDLRNCLFFAWLACQDRILAINMFMNFST